MELNYYEMLLLILKKRRFLFWITTGFTLASIGISLLTPVRYKASTVLMPPVSQSINLMSMMTRGNLISDPEIGGTGLLPGMISPSDIFAFILKSGTVKSIVIEQCGLVDHYKLRKTYQIKPEKAMYVLGKMLTKNTNVRVTPERFIAITVEDKDRNKAAEIANWYAQALDRVYLKITMTQGGKMREFIEKRLTEEETLLSKMEDSLKIFQQRNRTVSITDEMKAVVEMASQLEARIVSQKIELDALQEYSSTDNIQVKVLEKQIEVAQKELDKIMKGDRSKMLFVPYSRAAEVGMQLARLMRDVKIHQEVYGLLVQQLEQAKILEAKDTPRIQVLERADPPYRKSWPKRSLIVLVGLCIGAMTGILYVLLFDYLFQHLAASNSDFIASVKDVLGRKA